MPGTLIHFSNLKVKNIFNVIHVLYEGRSWSTFAHAVVVVHEQSCLLLKLSLHCGTPSREIEN